MSWLNHLAEYLEDEIAGYAVGTNIFIDTQPHTPDACIALYDAGGSVAPHGTATPWEEHALEVRSRAAGDAAALALAELVEAELNGKTATTMNSTLIVRWVRREGGYPSKLEEDQKGRVTYLARYRLQVQRTVIY